MLSGFALLIALILLCGLTFRAVDQTPPDERYRVFWAAVATAVAIVAAVFLK